MAEEIAEHQDARGVERVLAAQTQADERAGRKREQLLFADRPQGVNPP
jgi:hypothetical protein